jgi:hypothetical protein
MVEAKKAAASQNFVPIKEIRNGIVVLKDGSMRAVLIASSVNLALKSTEEQEATILQFQNFLNSIDFSLQISVQSRELDIRPYITYLEKLLSEQTIDLIKIQTIEYMEFIKKFTEASNIMSKNFFVVVPYSPATISTPSSSLSSLFGSKSNGSNKKADRFEESVSQIEQRIRVVQQGLANCGIRVASLGTEELVELYYKIFNPGDLDAPSQIN